ncbi:uncharacterized protein LOC115456167 isoform X2 [Manduca sexta]|uniref:THAP-type domain-containing protein n=1 Tax=Manduca sexta TaxID=7130 RepID=A0A922CFV3_MANSE|nr:uncharacterized protein LOC115456167 isoform X2 [Manduca sexta]KAG6443928.1 hypothetical protein O3G_MSEX003104 [Manduca sexta]
MGYYCTVPQCTSLAGKTKNVKFHRFPRDVTMADKWNDILKRGKPYTKYSKVCSLHFTQADYNVTTMGQWKTLSKDAVPSQNLPKLNPDGTVMVIRKSRTVKYREVKKEDNCDKTDKWPLNTIHHQQSIPAQDTTLPCAEQHDINLAYRLQNLNALANNISPQHPQPRPADIPQNHLRPKKQDAIMQTDPVNSEEDDTQPNNSYNEVSDKIYETYQIDFRKEDFEKKFEPRDYRKSSEDYIPQTNEEYNKEAEKYALERKTLYDKIDYQKALDSVYPKIGEIYGNLEKYPRQEYTYQNGYSDSVDMLRNQQHNLQMLQAQHRVTENQNFFNENQIKQEIDIQLEDDKYLYERTKDQLGDANPMYNEGRRLVQQERILEHIQHQVKQEPEGNGCENVLPPQTSPYYPPNGHENVSTAGFYESLPRPGPELLIAKQNALAAHTQLWQNTMKRPFFYSESPPYNGSQLLHRFEI